MKSSDGRPNLLENDSPSDSFVLRTKSLQRAAKTVKSQTPAPAMDRPAARKTEKAPVSSGDSRYPKRLGSRKSYAGADEDAPSDSELCKNAFGRNGKHPSSEDH